MSNTYHREYPYQDFAEKHLGIVSQAGPEVMTRCPFHNSNGAKLQFNVESGLFVCFSCHVGGGVEKIAREVGVMDFTKPEASVAYIYEKLRALDAKVEEERVYPEKMLDRYKFDTDYWGPHKKSCKKSCRDHREFDKKTIKAFDLGYDIMDDYVTIPVRNMNGQLLGVTKRYLDPDVEMRYRYPKGFKKASHLFASWLVELHDYDTVVITEGAVDAMRCWQAGIPAVAQYGSAISHAQIRLLRRLGIRQVILFFDDDPAGVTAEKRCKGISMHSRKGRNVEEYDITLDMRREFLMKQVVYTHKMKSDPGDMSVKEIQKAVDAAIRIT